MRRPYAVLTCCAALVATAAAPLAQTAQEIVGTDLPEFSLPSTEARLASYRGDHYGKHHLILTFFPAAFTPV